MFVPPAWRRHGSNRRRRTGKGNLVPRLGALDFGDHVELELEMAPARGDQQIRLPSRTIFSESGNFTGNTATSPSSNGAELSPVGLGVNVQSEPRLVVGQPAVVADFAEYHMARR